MDPPWSYPLQIAEPSVLNELNFANETLPWIPVGLDITEYA